MVCEGQTDIIVCPVGRTLNIRQANYGRQHNSICGYQANDNCVEASHLSTLKGECDGERVCFLNATNAIWGDTCPYTYKYLEVDYECSTFPELRLFVSCSTHERSFQCLDRFL